MTVTDDLNALSGHAQPDMPLSGRPSRIWHANVTALNPDGTIDCSPANGSRAGKIGVLVPSLHHPVVGDTVLLCDLNGDQRHPVMIAALTAGIPTVTGSKAGNAALASLLAALTARGWIIDHTT